MTPTHGDDLRERMIEFVMRRDRLARERAAAIVGGMGPADLTRLELELVKPAHDFNYDPFA